MLHKTDPAVRFNDSNMRSSRPVGKGLSMSKKQRGLKAYGDVRDQQVKQTTDPQKLIKLLFDKACVLVRASMESLDQDDHESFQKSCLHALQIILSLRFVLRLEEGDELARSLFDTYTSIAASLFRARERNDAASLEKIYVALDELRQAWNILLTK